MAGTHWSGGGPCANQWEGLQPLGLRAAPSPEPLRSPLGLQFLARTRATRQRLKGACRTQALVKDVCQTPTRVKQSIQLLCKHYFPLQRKERKYWTFLRVPDFEAAGCTSPFLFSLGSKKLLMLGSRACSAGCMPLLLPPDVLVHSFTSPPAWGTCMRRTESICCC